MTEIIRHMGPSWFPRLFDVLGGLEDPRWDWANSRIADLEAENARLQERVKEAEQISDGLHAAVLMGSEHTKALERERDGYKARDKLRGEALGWAIHELENAANTRLDELRNWMHRLDFEELERARAAIAISPEQAREKEGNE